MKQNKTKKDSIPRKMAYGILMGLSDGTPGFSGGTTLSLLNFYDKLIINFKGIIKPETGKTRFQHLLWVIPFLIMWIITLLGFTLLINYISEKQQGVAAVLMFATFALLSTPLFLMVNNLNIRKESKDKLSKKQFDKKIIALMILGGLLMLLIAFVVRYAFDAKDGGVSMLKHSTGVIEWNGKNIFLVIAAGFCAGFAMLIPGISGSLILYLFNVYTDITGTLSAAIHGDLKGAIPILCILIVSILIGIITSVLITSTIIKKWKKEFLAFSFGLVCCSFAAILISLSSADYQTLNNPLTLGLSIGAILIAIGLNILFIFYLKKQNILKYNFKKR